eukprot:scaffold5346_cov54-Cylindrotheca_fusiformis.AAC.1
MLSTSHSSEERTVVTELSPVGAQGFLQWVSALIPKTDFMSIFQYPVLRASPSYLLLLKKTTIDPREGLLYDNIILVSNT